MKLLLLPILSFLAACATVTPAKFSPEKAAAIVEVSKDSNTLCGLDQKFKKDKDVVMAAVKKDPHNLVFADKSLQEDKEIVLSAVSRMGILVVDIDENNPLFNDPDIILAAARDNYATGAVHMASKALKNDP